MISVLEIDTTTPDYILTVSISSELIFSDKKTLIVKRSLSEYENLYLYLLHKFPFSIVLPPPFMSQPDFLKKKTILFLESIVGKEVDKNDKVVEFLTSTFKFEISLKNSSESGWNFFKEDIEEIDLFYTEISVKVEKFLDKIQEIGSNISTRDFQLVETIQELENSTEFFRILTFLKILSRKEVKILQYLKENLNDELIYIKRWLNSIHLSLKEREKILQKYSTSCKNTQKNLKKLEKMQSLQNLSSDKVSKKLQEFEKIKTEEQSCRIEFRKVNEELKPSLVYHMNEIEMELIGTWGRYAYFQREIETEFLNALK
jgi:hypothetical protein